MYNEQQDYYSMSIIEKEIDPNIQRFVKIISSESFVSLLQDFKDSVGEWFEDTGLLLSDYNNQDLFDLYLNMSKAMERIKNVERKLIGIGSILEYETSKIK